ncbi:unnamed protein product [Anisakis simplex]|uniref:Gluconokinase n=1 Tax=Anisakis simplex TaxID=6269 RepID=A0A0M3JWF5_ANISI|nr:unnamed protein product [Anisakis simplex]
MPPFQFIGEKDRRISLVYKQFAILSQLIAALDDHLFITRQVRDQLALLSATKQLHVHFYRYMLVHFNEHLPTIFTQRFNFTPRDEVITNIYWYLLLSHYYSYFNCNYCCFEWNESVMVSSQLVSFERFQLENERIEYGKIIEMQKCVRKFGSYSKEIGEDDELIEITSSVEGEMLYSIDEACTVVQCWERVYQSVTRFNYLKEIRRKAYDLKTSHKPVDPLKAIIMLQARTRGMLARKMVNNWRNAEMKVLEMNVESLLRSKIDARKGIRYTRNVHGYVHISHIRQHKFRSNLASIASLPRNFMFMFILAESLYHELLIADIIKHRPKTECISLNDLITFTCMAHIGKTKRLLFDCRTIVYCTTVIPHILKSWNFAGNDLRRGSLLIVGDENCGKTAWCCAIAEFCAATRVSLSAKEIALKGAKKLIRTIEQNLFEQFEIKFQLNFGEIYQKITSFVLKFAKRDNYCVVEIDHLEVFNDCRKKAKTKSIRKLMLCSLLESLQNTNAQIIGMSRTFQLDKQILDFFVNILCLPSSPSNNSFDVMVDRLSRRLENDRLPRIPTTISDLWKAGK